MHGEVSRFSNGLCPVLVNFSSGRPRGAPLVGPKVQAVNLWFNDITKGALAKEGPTVIRILLKGSPIPTQKAGAGLNVVQTIEEDVGRGGTEIGISEIITEDLVASKPAGAAFYNVGVGQNNDGSKPKNGIVIIGNEGPSWPDRDPIGIENP